MCISVNSLQAQETGFENVLVGDVDLSGSVNFGDIPAFIFVLQNGIYTPEADANLDGFLNFTDIPAWICILSGEGCVPF